MDLVAERHMAHRFCEHDLRAPPLRGIMNSDQLPGLVYASDMVKHYGDACPISDANPTGSRVSSQGLVLSFDGKTLKNHAGGSDGVASGGVVLGGAQGVRGPATSFDGVDDVLTFSGIPASQEYTVRMLYERARLYTAAEIYWSLNGAIYGRHIAGSSTGDIYVGADSTGYPTGGVATESYPLTVGKHDVVITWNATSIKVYIDGILQISDIGVTGPTSLSGGSFSIMDRSSYYTAGNVSEAQVWTRRLSNAEVRQLFEDSQGWVQNIANPHCTDIDPAHPLGSDRDVLLGGANTPITDANPTGSRVSSDGLVLSFDGATLRNHAGGADGIASGGVALGGVMGPRGPATSFDGVDDYISPAFANMSNRTAYTIEGWFYATEDRAASVYSEGNATINQPTINIYMFTGGVFYFTHRDDANNTMNISPPNTVSINAWHHYVAVRYGPASFALFMDGVCVGTNTSVTIGATNNTNSHIGVLERLSKANFFKGTIAETKCWSRALTNAEIREEYEDFWGHWSSRDSNPHCLDISDEHPLGTDRVSDDGLVLSLDMETLTDQGRLKDFSGNGNHIPLINGPKYKIGTVKNGFYQFTAASNQCGQLAHNSSMDLGGSFTIFAVVNPNGMVSGQGILSDAAPPYYGWAYELAVTNKQSIRVADGTDLVSQTSNTPLPTGKASIIAVTVEQINDTQSVITFYLNGVPDGQITIDQVMLDGAYYLRLARDAQYSGVYWDGALGQIALFKGAKTADEIATLTADAQKASGLGQGCVLALDMETQNPNGTLRDMSGQGNHALVINGPKYQRSGIKNGEYAFDQTNRMEVLDCDALSVDTTGALTISIWYKHNGQGTLFTKGISSTNYEYVVSISGSKLVATAYTPSGTGVCNVTSVTTLITGAAYHLVIVYRYGIGITLYINGAQDNANGTWNAGYVNSAGPVRISSRDGSGGNSGPLGPIHAFGKVLSADEISKLYIDGQKMLGLVQGNLGNAPAPVGSAVDFLGSTLKYIEIQQCPAIQNLNAMTAGAWVQNDVAGGWSYILGDMDAGTEKKGFAVYKTNAELIRFAVGNGAGYSVQATVDALPVGKWAFVGGSNDGSGNLSAFYEGKTYGPFAATYQIAAPNQPLRIGYNPNLAGWDGRIAYPFVANQAWPASLIQWLMRMQLNARW